ncbi:MAG: hypothetical protein ACXVDA_17440 [Ktedonobacterales bacterium]
MLLARNLAGTHAPLRPWHLGQQFGRDHWAASARLALLAAHDAASGVSDRRSLRWRTGRRVRAYSATLVGSTKMPSGVRTTRKRPSSIAR